MTEHHPIIPASALRGPCSIRRDHGLHGVVYVGDVAHYVHGPCRDPHEVLAAYQNGLLAAYEALRDVDLADWSDEDCGRLERLEAPVYQRLGWTEGHRGEYDPPGRCPGRCLVDWLIQLDPEPSDWVRQEIEWHLARWFGETADEGDRCDEGKEVPDADM